MSSQLRSGMDTQQGAVCGAGAYLVGLVATILAAKAQLSNELIAYRSFGSAGYLLAYLEIHELNLVSFGDFLSQLLPMTVFVICLQVGAGYLLASRTAEGQAAGGPAVGASIAIGYFAMATMTAVALVLLTATGPLLENIILPLVITGAVYPIAFGGFGGFLARKL